MWITRRARPASFAASSLYAGQVPAAPPHWFATTCSTPSARSLDTMRRASRSPMPASLASRSMLDTCTPVWLLVPAAMIDSSSLADGGRMSALCTRLTSSHDFTAAPDHFTHRVRSITLASRRKNAFCASASPPRPDQASHSRSGRPTPRCRWSMACSAVAAPRTAAIARRPSIRAGDVVLDVITAPPRPCGPVPPAPRRLRRGARRQTTR